MDKKAQMDISFSWIFAIIVGIIIIIGAVYGLTQFTKSQQSVETIEGAREIGVLLGPLEIGFEAGESTAISMPVDTRIYTSCRLEGEFGRQGISLSEKFKEVWSNTGVESSFSNKYLFLDRVIEGKNFFLFSKSFEFPFPGGTLIYMTSSKDAYCFADASEDIKDGLKRLNQPNFYFEDCPERSITICEDSSCDIYINENQNYVEKRGDKSYFEGEALMYAAIFSEKEFYDCQVKRLMQRVVLLSDIYIEKNIQNSRTGCLTDSNSELQAISNFASSFESSEDFDNNLNWEVDELKDKNNFADCKLW